MKRLKAGLIASFNFPVAETPSCVDIFDVAGLHQVVDKVLFGLGFEAYHVHAHLSAVVATGKPIPTCIAKGGLTACPRDPVTLSSKVEVTGLLFAYRAQLCHGQTYGAIASWVNFMSTRVSCIGSRCTEVVGSWTTIIVVVVVVELLAIISIVVVRLSVVAGSSVVVGSSVVSWHRWGWAEVVIILPVAIILPIVVKPIVVALRFSR